MRIRLRDAIPVLLTAILAVVLGVEVDASREETPEEYRLEVYDDDSPLNPLERAGIDILRLAHGRLAVRFFCGHETRPTDEEIASQRRRRDWLLNQAIPILVETPGIVCLELWDATGLSDAQFARFSNLGDLVILRIQNAPITDATIARIGKLERLRYLSLLQCHVARPGLEKLSALPDLEDLDLSSCEVSDDDLEPVVRLKKLKKLALRATRIGNGSVALLKRLSELETLDVRDTQVDQHGVDELRQSNPKLKVFR